MGLDEDALDYHRSEPPGKIEIATTKPTNTLQFYPPTVGDWPGTNDAVAATAITLLAAGVALQVFGAVTPLLADFGVFVAVLGASLHAFLVFGAFVANPT